MIAYLEPVAVQVLGFTRQISIVEVSGIIQEDGMHSEYTGVTNGSRPWLERCLSFIDANHRQILILIFVLAAVFSIFVNLDRLPPAADTGGSDTWWAIALNLTHGEGYSLCPTNYFPFCGPSNQATAAREPLPVLLFAGIALISGESLWAAAIAELLIYLASLLAVYLLTREWSNLHAALLAAALWAIYIPAHELIPQVSGDLLAALLVCIGILFVMRARRTRHPREWLVAGTSLGLASVTRSGTLVIVATVILGFLLESWWQRLHWRPTLSPVIILSSLVLLLMAPWLTRNRIVLGRPILGSSLIGYNLYRHNYMVGTENYLRHIGGAEGLAATEALLARRTDLLGTENEAQMDLIYRREAIARIRAYPAQYVLLCAYRFLPLWFNWGYPQAYGREPDRTDKLILVLQGALLILTLIGTRGILRESWPLWSSVLAVCLVYMAVDSRLLYLIPVMPLVISLSANGAMRLMRQQFSTGDQGELISSAESTDR
jgi:hypothetical protein